MSLPKQPLEVILNSSQLGKDGVSVSEINVRNDLSCGYFGKHEVEVSAGKLVTFLQERGTGWSSFTIIELVEFYRSRQWDPNMMFFGLLGPWFDDGWLGGYKESRPFLAIDCTGEYNVTIDFIERCTLR